MARSLTHRITGSSIVFRRDARRISLIGEAIGAVRELRRALGSRAGPDPLTPRMNSVLADLSRIEGILQGRANNHVRKALCRQRRPK